MRETPEIESPKWSWTTKLVVALSFVAIVAWLINRFRAFLGPLLLAFVLTYLSYPAARYLRRKLKLSWRLSVTLFYVLLVIVLLGLIVLGGYVLIEQSQSLFNLVQQAALVTIPEYISSLSTQVIKVGTFEFKLSQLDLQTVNNQILATVQPALGQIGTLIGKLATSAASFLGWISFIILISYFVTAESGGMSSSLINFEVPGYAADFRKLAQQLDRVWNVFLRGQLTLFLLTVIVYVLVLTILGVRYSLGLAILTGFGRFLPYIGPFIAWLAIGLVAYFQGVTIFGMSAVGYVILVVSLSIVIDSSFDNIISPKFMGSSLKVHPAAVLIAALIAANIIGLVGVLLAAPVLATLKLLAEYAIRKMFDQDPWTGIDLETAQSGHSILPKFAQSAFEWLSENWKRRNKSREKDQEKYG
ncbi:MAG: AI-2E family transporter [Chloroflexi bacterium]|nr:AI-2E family transporter [Chloroflexota bacterium]